MQNLAFSADFIGALDYDTLGRQDIYPWKDGELVSAKFWNSKGEEVDSKAESYE